MFAVIRLTGNVGISKKTELALEMLGLKAANNCVVVPENPSYKGMIKRVKDYVTYGIIRTETLSALLSKRGRLEGDKKLDDASLKAAGCKSADELAKALMENKAKLADAKLKKTFRLTPPAHGFKDTMHQYPKGDIGNRGEAINELIERMI